ncbi:MAG: hypothetical protein Q7R52_04715 [archaeon]|nr:hypothetical protein [archaeon]
MIKINKIRNFLPLTETFSFCPRENQGFSSPQKSIRDFCGYKTGSFESKNRKFSR